MRREDESLFRFFFKEASVLPVPLHHPGTEYKWSIITEEGDSAEGDA
jgi:hypothetical protein